jgi:hypothetical protein
MGPPSSTLDVELANLDGIQEIPDSYKPRDTHESHTDDYDSDDDEHGGERALLQVGGNTQTRWEERAQSTAAKLWEQTFDIIVEVSCSFLVN